MVTGRKVPYPRFLPARLKLPIVRGGSMDFNVSDILFLVVVLWLATEILNNGDWGGGRRVRTGDRVPVPAG